MITMNPQPYVNQINADFTIFDADEYYATLNQDAADIYEVPDNDSDDWIGQIYSDPKAERAHYLITQYKYRRRDGSTVGNRKRRIPKWDWSNRKRLSKTYGYPDDFDCNWSDVYPYWESNEYWAEKLKREEDPEIVWVQRNLVDNNVTYVEGNYYINGTDVTHLIDVAMQGIKCRKEVAA